MFVVLLQSQDQVRTAIRKADDRILAGGVGNVAAGFRAAAETVDPAPPRLDNADGDSTNEEDNDEGPLVLASQVEPENGVKRLRVSNPSNFEPIYTSTLP